MTRISVRSRKFFRPSVERLERRDLLTFVMAPTNPFSPTGTNPTGLEVADLNSDGNLDVAVANHSPGTISVALGVGDGSFLPPTHYSNLNNAYDLVIIDVSGDGILDLVTAHWTVVSVLRGNGDGTFQSSISHPAGSSAVAIDAADFDSDGDFDVTVAAYNGGFDVLRNNGDGTFQPALHVNGGDRCREVKTGDLNGDTNPDVVTAGYDGKVFIHLGNGNGTFAAPTSYTIGSWLFGVDIADLNGDAQADLAVANYLGTTVSVLAGNGDGHLQRAGQLFRQRWPTHRRCR